MIKTFRHKELQKFFETGSHAGIKYMHIKKLEIILSRLQACQSPEDMNLPGLNLHPLIGAKKGFYSVKVDANWRIVFRFNDNYAVDVDYLDYH